MLAGFVDAIREKWVRFANGFDSDGRSDPPRHFLKMAPKGVAWLLGHVVTLEAWGIHGYRVFCSDGVSAQRIAPLG